MIEEHRRTDQKVSDRFRVSVRSHLLDKPDKKEDNACKNGQKTPSSSSRPDEQAADGKGRSKQTHVGMHSNPVTPRKPTQTPFQTDPTIPPEPASPTQNDLS